VKQAENNMNVLSGVDCLSNIRIVMLVVSTKILIFIINMIGLQTALALKAEFVCLFGDIYLYLYCYLIYS